MISDYFGIADIVNTQLLDLSQAGCTTGSPGTDSIDASLVLVAIGDLAAQYNVTPQSALTQALIDDISSDGQWDGKANGPVITVQTSTVPVALSLIEGNGLAGLAAAAQAFLGTANNQCQALPSQLFATDLANPGLF